MNNPNYKALFLDALKKNVDNPKWQKGDFVGIKTVSNTKVGDVGQDFVEGLCEQLSMPCKFPLKEDSTRKRQSPWDIEICGVKFELKTATEDVSGSFQFNHLRYHRPYDAVLCLGVSPNSLFFNLWTKADVATGKAGTLVTMEAKANASFKLTKKQNQLFPITEFEAKVKEFTEKFSKS